MQAASKHVLSNILHGAYAAFGVGVGAVGIAKVVNSPADHPKPKTKIASYATLGAGAATLGVTGLVVNRLSTRGHASPAVGMAVAGAAILGMASVITGGVLSTIADPK